MKEYAFSTVLDTPYENAISRVTDALKEEGFGILTQIDVRATLKKKLDKDFRKYMILGTCNPPYAFRSLEADLDVGLLLPCNEAFEKSDIFLSGKEGENFYRRNTFGISRIKI
ncbi:MAG: DUF302 domain-containing protein [Pseudomonadota bacterium]